MTKPKEPAVPASVLDDDEDGGWMTHKDDSESLWDSTDDDDAEPVAAEPVEDERPLREVLSAIGRQGVSTRMQNKPLSAQSDEWIISTYRRLNGLLVEHPNNPDAESWRADCEKLDLAGRKRGMPLDLLKISDAPKPVVTSARRGGKTAASDAVSAAAIVPMPIDLIDPDPTQARDEGADEDLSDSIAAQGVLQPIRIYAHPTSVGRFMIDDGERRYRGSLKAGLTSIPVRVVEAPPSEGAKLLRQLLLNEGKRLKPMEEARTFRRIMASEGWNIQQLADHLGRSKSTVSDRVAIADAPAPFVSYFEKGSLTAAAAPILRQLADLPERKLAAIAQHFGADFDIEDAVAVGKPIALRDVEQAIDNALSSEMREIAAVLEPEYKGKIVMVGKRKFAVDVAAYDSLEKKRQASAPKSVPAKREPDAYQRKQLAEQKKAREKSELRRLQIRALSAKLPTSLGGSVNQADGWSLFLVKYLVREMTHDTQRSACKLLGLEPPKAGAHMGYQFDKAILKYAEGLKAPARVQLALQLLLAHDMYVSPNYNGGADRINDAAKLAKFDLSKVKSVETSKTPVFNGPAGSVNKKKGSRAFMQPQQVSDQLAAVVGAGPMVRTDVTMKLWAYIKKHGLQDPKERRMIKADEKLQSLFGGKKRVSMFEMTKLINKHVR